MRRTRDRRVFVRHVALGAVLVLTCAGAATAQLAVRPEDPLGLSIREERVRVIHSLTPEVPGTSGHLIRYDPWLAYQRGRSYFFREWRPADGVFTHLPDRPEAASANSCGICHNLPFPSGGSGGTVAIEVGVGRSAPHLFGLGLLETVGLQIRAQILAEFDDNGNGYLDHPAETRGRRAVIQAAPGVEVDYGSLDDSDGNGRPDLDPAIILRMVDREGERVLLTAQGRVPRLTDPDIVGYDFAVGVFATSAGDHQFPSLRTFSKGVFITIYGILPEPEGEVVPTLTPRKDYGYLAKEWGTRSLPGAFLSEVLMPADPRASVESGRPATVTTGELDLLEFFQLNHPKPTLAPQTDETRRGRTLLTEFGCTSCHLPRWVIQPRDEARGLPGDRRFFDLEVAHNPATNRLEGELVRLTREVEGPDGTRLSVPRYEGFVVEDVFTDLRHHDLGRRFWQYDYRDGKVYATKSFRTAALWGVGSTAPYGHDAHSQSLDEVIRRHGGEAEAATQAYVEAPEKDRFALLEFLESLVLYQPEGLPTDLDGDGRIAETFRVDGGEVGPEVFRPEVLFRATPRYRGWINGPDGDRFFSYELLNVAEAYGENLEGLRDRDRDGVPDLLRSASAEVGEPVGDEGRTADHSY